jgi:hypothetical protein
MISSIFSFSSFLIDRYRMWFVNPSKPLDLGFVALICIHYNLVYQKYHFGNIFTIL